MTTTETRATLPLLLSLNAGYVDIGGFPVATLAVRANSELP